MARIPATFLFFLVCLTSWVTHSLANNEMPNTKQEEWFFPRRPGFGHPFPGIRGPFPKPGGALPPLPSWPKWTFPKPGGALPPLPSWPKWTFPKPGGALPPLPSWPKWTFPKPGEALPPLPSWPKWTFPKPGGAHPPLPSWPKWTFPPLPGHMPSPGSATQGVGGGGDSGGDDITKCWSALHGVEGCVQQFFAGFLTHSLSLNAECCNALNAVGPDCSSPVFGIFKSPAFQFAIKEICSKPAAPAPPKSATPAPPKSAAPAPPKPNA